MKKFFLLATVACLAMTACEDVPAPYEIFNQTDSESGGEGSKTSLPYTNANLKDWEVVTPQGVAWSLGSTYAKASGYANNNTTPTESWLISPALDLTTSQGAAHIAFEHVIRYVNAQNAPITNHTMWIATDYAGDVATASWTKLDYHPVESATQTWDFYDADEIAIPEAFINKTAYVAFKFVCGASSTTWEVKNFKLLAGKAAESTITPVVPDEPDQPVGDAKGSGTAADPYNVAGVLNYTKALAADANSTSEVYFKGIVSSIKEISTVDNYNNATFYISDDGTTNNQFYVYRCLGLNKADITAADLVKVGDEVLLCGKVVNYRGNTPETVQKEAWIVSINDNGSQVDPEDPGQNPGTPDDPGAEVDGDCLTFDVAANCFNIPSAKQTTAGTYTCGNYSITITPSEGNNYYFNTTDKYVILGKLGATVEFNGFDFDVAKIVIRGNSKASANTLQNIYVGDEAVSTQTKGAVETNTYEIKEGYRAAGTHYVLKVESAHNTQFTQIKVYKAQ